MPNSGEFLLKYLTSYNYPGYNLLLNKNYYTQVIIS